MPHRRELRDALAFIDLVPAATRLATASTPDLWQSEAQLTARYGDPTDIHRWLRESGSSRTAPTDESIDLDVPIAFVSNRLHDSHGARVADSDFYRLIRITDGSKTVFDESVCEVHHTRMKLVEANVEYGMIGVDSSEVEFPHHRDWIRGGCMVGDVKRAERYVCSECVVASEKYKREHLDETRVSE